MTFWKETQMFKKSHPISYIPRRTKIQKPNRQTINWHTVSMLCCSCQSAEANKQVIFLCHRVRLKFKGTKRIVGFSYAICQMSTVVQTISGFQYSVAMMYSRARSMGEIEETSLILFYNSSMWKCHFGW